MHVWGNDKALSMVLLLCDTERRASKWPDVISMPAMVCAQTHTDSKLSAGMLKVRVTRMQSIELLSLHMLGRIPFPWLTCEVCICHQDTQA